ncbi:MAG: hypothetical protein P1U47_03050 [Zhongshania sp.]|uniref:hypothetical protein n=1 Tax=Zhongshania sp. TaxID=1971902 RepID=UPI00261535A8|nr:hypothetical protein [Zhongshania sp.]MDF1691324.1 hypothetical protein [Zhongshania sp.]
MIDTEKARRWRYRIVAIAAVVMGVSPFAYSAKNCDANMPVSAQYTIRIHTAKTQANTVTNMGLWRSGNSVAEQYPAKKVTEIWERNHVNTIKLNRYFDAHERGIEYAPSDIKGLRNDDDWSMKRQLIANSLLAKMTLNKKIGKGCEREEIYTLHDDTQLITLTWLPASQLVKNYQRELNGQLTVWALTNKSSDSKMIKAFFDKYLNYQTTDYADIGDSESDPFIRKMINLGFIDHGSSGIYDAQGNGIGSSHKH